MTSLRTSTHKNHRRNNPDPGREGHIHHDAAREDHPRVSDAIWAAYGDHYPGSRCRRLTQANAERLELALRSRQRLADELWMRVQRSYDAVRALGPVPA
jgi:hypothetical protein